MNNLVLLLIWKIGINRGLVMIVLYVIYVVISILIIVVDRYLIPFPLNPYYDSSVICHVGRGDEAENFKTRGA